MENHTPLPGWSLSLPCFLKVVTTQAISENKKKSHQGGSPVPGQLDIHSHLFPVHQCIPCETIQADAQLGTSDVPGTALSAYELINLVLSITYIDILL